MNAPLSPCPAFPGDEPFENQTQTSTHWYRFVDRFSQDTRCPVCEGAGQTQKDRRCPTCHGAGEIHPTRKLPNSRLDYSNACRQARRLLRRARVNPSHNFVSFATTEQGALQLTIHLPRPSDQPLFCLTANSQHGQQIAAALARTLLQQGHAV